MGFQWQPPYMDFQWVEQWYPMVLSQVGAGSPFLDDLITSEDDPVGQRYQMVWSQVGAGSPFLDPVGRTKVSNGVVAGGSQQSFLR